MPRRPPTPRTKLTTVPRLAVERIAFERDRMALLVRVPEGADASLGVRGADRLLAARPSLAFHTCLNAEDAPFAEVLARTSLPHALEHLVIDLQAANPACASDATFVGTTEWLSKRDGLARVTVNFTDDLIALGALKDALALLEGTVE